MLLSSNMLGERVIFLPERMKLWKDRLPIKSIMIMVLNHMLIMSRTEDMFVGRRSFDLPGVVVGSCSILACIEERELLFATASITVASCSAVCAYLIQTIQRNHRFASFEYPEVILV